MYKKAAQKMLVKLIIVHLVFEQGQASVHKNCVCNLHITLVEDVMATSLSPFKAARIRNGEVSSDGCATIVSVANDVVVASAAVQVVLHGIPFGRDVLFNSIPEI